MQFLRVFFHQCNSQLPLFHREEFYEIILSLYMENLMNQYHLPPTILKLINHFLIVVAVMEIKPLVGLMFINQRFNNF